MSVVPTLPAVGATDCSGDGAAKGRRDPARLRTVAAELLVRRFHGDGTLAKSLLQSVTGRQAVFDLDAHECANLIDYLDHTSESDLVAIARRGTLPRVVVHVELALSVRGALDARRGRALIDRLRSVIIDPNTAPPGVSVSSVVLSWESESPQRGGR